MCKIVNDDSRIDEDDENGMQESALAEFLEMVSR